MGAHEKTLPIEGPDGALSLAQLFDGRSQLIVHHFMFAPGWKEVCKSRSFWADGYDGITIRLANRDATFAAVSRAPTLRRRIDESGAMRPDIAIFGKEGSAIIIEFKAPGVSMDDHIGDLSEYAHLLAAKSNGRLKKFYGYLVGDTIRPTPAH